MKSYLKYLALGLITFLMVFPIFWLVSASFKNPIDIFAIPPLFFPPNPTLDHYVLLFFEAEIYKYIFNSIIVAVFTTCLTLTIGTLAAYSLARFRLPYKMNERLSFWVLST